MRRGSTPNIETSVGICRFDLKLTREVKDSFQSCADSLSQRCGTYPGPIRSIEEPITRRCSDLSFERGLKVSFVPETKNALILTGKTSEKSCIQEQRMVAVTAYILLLQSN